MIHIFSLIVLVICIKTKKFESVALLRQYLKHRAFKTNTTMTR